MGCLHMTIQTVVLIETLVALQSVDGVMHIYSTQDHAGSHCSKWYPVFAWKGMSEDEFWWRIDQTAEADGWELNMILDDSINRMHEKHRVIKKYKRLI